MAIPSPTAGRAPAKFQQNQIVSSISPPSEHHPQQQLFPVAEVEFDGMTMGVLSDGTPYLHLRGLARLCGIDHSVLQRLSANWSEERMKPRGAKIQEILVAQGHMTESLNFWTNGPLGETHAYTDAVCMAILEYYAFEATQSSAGVALKNYRLLARSSLRAFIYKGCGYDPTQQLPALWRNFHDRVSLNFNAVPEGYFSVFKQIADLIVALGQHGLHIHDNFVPDISVGQCWGRHWNSLGGDLRYGQRIHYKHNYPEYYPQAASNPQEPWCYPEIALGEFQRWFRENYVKGGRLENYLQTKAKDATLPVSFVNQAVALLAAPA